MKILLLYYTGTYNTRYLTNMIKNEFIQDGHEIEIKEIDVDTEPITLDRYELIGLGYPIYAFNAPKIFIDYLKKLEFNKNARYFIYKDSGETLKFNNASSREIKHLLRKNKLKLVNEKHFIMPYNIMFRFEDNCIKEFLSYDEKLVKILKYEIDHNIVRIIKNNPLYELISLMFLIQRPGAYLNHFFYRVDETKCISCLRCVKDCPTNNIVVDQDGKIKFNRDCIMCMRCSLYCPTDAISIGMLNKLRVNKPYYMDKIKNDESLDGHFIKEKQRGFFRCYKRTYKYIDSTYDKYFKKG